ncbi:hypothetical protein BJX68DRAFT_164191 [Aspergillus pseudodeflectus]|uniref:Secreted protein n=1 Tax=Aspergillus pseudodeflectus TaxID=176178 RepID=A0ABR4L199_9EURO
MFFIFFTLHTRAVAVQLFRSLESAAISVLRRDALSDANETFWDLNTGFLRHNVLTNVHQERQNAAVSQQTIGPWTVGRATTFGDGEAGWVHCHIK